jgi:hypothetical protein
MVLDGEPHHYVPSAGLDIACKPPGALIRRAGEQSLDALDHLERNLVVALDARAQRLGGSLGILVDANGGVEGRNDRALSAFLGAGGLNRRPLAFVDQAVCSVGSVARANSRIARASS